MIKINSELIGKEVRIDFRENKSDLVTDIFDTGFNLFKKDFVKLKVLQKNILFEEIWEIYSDSGYISNQHIESKYLPKIKITEMILKRVTPKLIIVSA